MDAIDSTVLVAAMVASEPHHQACSRLLGRGRLGLFSHGLAEVFSTLTGGRRPFRIGAGQAAEIVECDYAPALKITPLSGREILRAMGECEARGVRGGAVYDFLHLTAARKAKAERILTLNVSDFRAFRRQGDPEVV